MKYMAGLMAGLESIGSLSELNGAHATIQISFLLYFELQNHH